MGKHIKLKKGHNIKLVGDAEERIISPEKQSTFAARPGDFLHKRFKVLVEEGNEVKAGTPLAFDKQNEQLKICSPVSGEVVAIKRGAKRKLEEIVVLADKQNNYVDFGVANPNDLSREDIINRIQSSGAWYLIKQRPFDVVASASRISRDIFISTFDTSPLAPNLAYALDGCEEDFQAGVNALAKITDGKVHLGLDGKSNSGFFSNIENAEKTSYSGKHPVGNVGIQLHHAKPLRKGELVWAINAQDVVTIGRLFSQGRYNTERLIALTGHGFKEQAYIKTFLGANVDDLIASNLSDGEQRVISGNVLTGRKAEAGEHLGTYHSMLTAIPEGRDLELFGWILPSYPRPNISPSFLSSYTPNKKFKVNTNMHGEGRAFVMSGQYEQVLPMNIFPVHLLKSILYKDYDEMEALGLMEVAPEDFAICEFVCTSKIPVQSIVREGLDLMFEDEN